MRTVLVTGASGFLGSALVPRLLDRGDKIYGLSRHPPKARENLTPLEGDILKHDLGLESVPSDIDACYHLAAIHRLGEDKGGSIWQTNVLGTQNVIDLCREHEIPHLYFVSTAYTQGRNAYEQSKALCETLVNASGIPRVTVFKPSIIVGTQQHFYPGHLSQFVKLVIQVHRRGELVRKRIEGTLRLPVVEPAFRMRANPKGKLNVVRIDDVARAIAEIDETGTYWLTHPDPPTLEQIASWVGDFIMVKVEMPPDFKPTLIETAFQRMSAAFLPYLWGDDLPSDLKDAQPVDRELVEMLIKKTILG